MRKEKGFTLVEMSIVLVIIGLIMGGILVGRELITAAETRAQITQIDKYRSAVNLFRTKYGGLPGDLNATLASQFGFSPGSGTGGNGVTSVCDGYDTGQRDGNGLIDGWGGGIPWSQTVGETALFWQDLGMAKLIDGQFPNNTTSTSTFNCCCAYSSSLSGTPDFVGSFFPVASIGHGNYVYVYETNGLNWFGVSAIQSTNWYGGVPTSAADISVIQAYNIDKKMDDGFPATGNVLAVYLTAGTLPYTLLQNAPNAATDSVSTCYNTTSGTYSIAAGGSACALSFVMDGM